MNIDNYSNENESNLISGDLTITSESLLKLKEQQKKEHVDPLLADMKLLYDPKLNVSNDGTMVKKKKCGRPKGYKPDKEL